MAKSKREEELPPRPKRETPQVLKPAIDFDAAAIGVMAAVVAKQPRHESAPSQPRSF